MKNKKQNQYLGVASTTDNRVKVPRQRFLGRVNINGVRKGLGTYDKEQDAAIAYDNEMIRNGELYKLNFPNSLHAIAARAAASHSTCTASAALPTLAAESATDDTMTTGVLATGTLAMGAPTTTDTTCPITAATVAIAAAKAATKLATDAITAAVAAIGAAKVATDLVAKDVTRIAYRVVAPITTVITSSLRGVTAVKNNSTGEYTGKWRARIGIPKSNGKSKELGTYTSEQDAGIAYEVAHAILYPSGQTAAIVSEQLDQLSINNLTQGAEHETVRSLDKI